MLILTRTPGQSIHIGDDIVVNVVQIKNNQVRIAVDAPKAVEVYRDEIYERVDRERKEPKGVSDIGPDSRIGTRRYLVRDVREGKGWWRADGHGYTQDIAEAGRFTAIELDRLALDEGQVITAAP